MVSPEQVREYIAKGLDCDELRVAGDGPALRLNSHSAPPPLGGR